MEARRNRMSRRLAAVVAAIALAGTAGAIGAPALPVHAAVAKPCSAGYRHAVIGGAHKCLRRGQFCARRYDSQYHKYGFHCHRRDSRGNYHLT
jgi:hypothetical protein